MDTDYIELHDSAFNHNSTSKSALCIAHQRQLSDGHTNERYTVKIRSILGGVENIISHYQSTDNNMDLSQTQLDQIKCIRTQKSIDFIESYNLRPTLTFHRKETLIYQCFSASMSIQITNIISHPICMAALSIMAITLKIIQYIDLLSADSTLTDGIYHILFNNYYIYDYGITDSISKSV